MSFVLHSIMVGDTEIQLSYSDPEAADAHGTEIHTAIITVEPALASEIAELGDAAEQLLAGWRGLRRESGPSG